MQLYYVGIFIPAFYSSKCFFFLLLCFFKKLKAWNDIEKVCASQRMRAGKGKMRTHHHIQCMGPCINYNEDNGIIEAFRNIPGITLPNVSKLNILKLAPGGPFMQLNLKGFPQVR